MNRPVQSLRVSGLQTFQSPFDDNVPPGALQVATNVVVDRPGLIEPRRGLNPLTQTFTGGQTADAATFWRGLLFAHLTNNTIAWWDPANAARGWTVLTGTYAPPAGEAMRFAQSNQNLFFTTSTGVFVLDNQNSIPRRSGGLKPVTPTLVATGVTGFQFAASQVGYRTLLGYRDANQNLVIGSPGPRLVISGFASPVATTAAGLDRDTNQVDVTTAAAHPYVVGDVVYLQSADPNFPSGNKVVTVQPDNTHFSYAETGADADSTVAQTFYYASRNVNITVYLPTNAALGWFLQVYRTAQSVDQATDPGDEMGLVYEYPIVQADINNSYYAFTDIVPDALRATALYTSPSIEGLVNANEPPPVATDIALFKDCMFFARTTSVYRLKMTLLSVGGSAGMQSGDTIILFDTADAGGYSATMSASSSEDIVNGLFKLYTTGTPAQNIANTAQSFCRIFSILQGQTRWMATYISGPDDPPGIILLESLVPGANPFVVATSDTALHLYWTPTIQPHTPVASGQLVRAGNVVSAHTSAAHTLQAGQLVQMLVFGADATTFPPGVKLVRTAVDNTHFTYSEVGVDAASTQQQRAVPASTGLASADATKNRIYFSKPQQPESSPLLNFLRVGSPDFNLLRVAVLRDGLFVCKEDGIFRVTGTDPSNFRVDPFDTTVKLIGNQTLVPLANQLWGLSTQGVVAIAESGVQIVSRSIEADILNLMAASLAQVKALSFAVAYESDRKFILWTTSPADTTKAAQAYCYNLFTNTWTLWTMPAACGVVDPMNDLLYVGDVTLATMRQERKTRTYKDYADETTGVTVNSITNKYNMVLASNSKLKVGDIIQQGANATTITLIGAAGLVGVIDSTGFVGGAATVYASYSCQAQWTPAALGDPGGLKQAAEVSFLFGLCALPSLDGAVSSLATALHPTFDFASDLVPTFQSVAFVPTAVIGQAAQLLKPVRVRLPQDMQHSTELNVRFSCQAAWGAFQLAGWSIWVDRLSERTVK